MDTIAPKATAELGVSSRSVQDPPLYDLAVDARGSASSEAQRWCALAVASLVGAGALSLAVVIGRLPFLNELIDDPLLFKRCLVVHVDLSLVVWFNAFIAGLLALRFRRSSGRVGTALFVTSAIGVVGMIAGGLAQGAQPVLANYIPVIDHAVFLWGLGLFFIGVVGSLVLSLTRHGSADSAGLPSAASIGAQASGIAVAIAGATWLAAVAGLPSGLDTHTYYEFAFWGAGHALQVANVCAMVAVWLWSAHAATGRAVLSSNGARLLFAALIAPHFALPLLTARGSLDTLYHGGSTLLMRWGIFPLVLTALALVARHLWRHRGALVSGRSRALAAGFSASAGLTALGFVLGACIRGSTTLIPAHYHASLGGVTVAFMTAAYLIASITGGPQSWNDLRWRNGKRQLALFGAGQVVFALGFAIGGAYGLGRKAYASEQHVRGLGEYIGLGTMGLGGLVAVAGGVWFLVTMLREIRNWWSRASAKRPYLNENQL